jgi:dephospho-CoA kinase
VLQDLLSDRGIPVNRESLQRIGEEIHLGLGQQWLGEELIKRMPSNGNLVIDGLRHPEDHAFLSEKFGPDFLHIHIDAPKELRRERYISEGSTEEFTEAAAHPIEANIPKLAALAHVTVSNVGTLSDFLSTIERIMNNYSSEEGRITWQ